MNISKNLHKPPSFTDENELGAQRTLQVTLRPRVDFFFVIFGKHRCSAFPKCTYVNPTRQTNMFLGVAKKQWGYARTCHKHNYHANIFQITLAKTVTMEKHSKPMCFTSHYRFVQTAKYSLHNKAMTVRTYLFSRMLKFADRGLPWEVWIWHPFEKCANAQWAKSGYV